MRASPTPVGALALPGKRGVRVDPKRPDPEASAAFDETFHAALRRSSEPSVRSASHEAWPNGAGASQESAAEPTTSNIAPSAPDDGGSVAVFAAASSLPSVLLQKTAPPADDRQPSQPPVGGPQKLRLAACGEPVEEFKRSAAAKGHDTPPPALSSAARISVTNHIATDRSILQQVGSVLGSMVGETQSEVHPVDGAVIDRKDRTQQIPDVALSTRQVEIELAPESLGAVRVTLRILRARRAHEGRGRGRPDVACLVGGPGGAWKRPEQGRPFGSRHRHCARAVAGAARGNRRDFARQRRRLGRRGVQNQR